MKTILRLLLDFIYPPICIHCSNVRNKNSHIFCSDCIALLQLLDPVEHCPYCFSSSYSAEENICESCLYQRPPFHGMAASFEYAGPSATLIKKLKYSNQPYLAKGAGAFLVAQLLQLQWPIPDLIVPAPIAFSHWLNRGYNQSLLLAQAVSEILQRPVANVLKRKSGDYSQAGLSLEQRKALRRDNFFLKKKGLLHNKVVLLIDDVMTSGSTMCRSAEALLEDHPYQIYGLTVCRTIGRGV